MPSYEDDAPRLSEIGRMLAGINHKIDDFRGEVRTALQDKVSKDVYNAERQADRDRILALESRARQMSNSFYSAVVMIVVAAVLAYVGLK